MGIDGRSWPDRMGACYDPAMTREQLDAILDRVRTWPKERQEDAAQVLLAMEGEAATPYVLDAEDEADIDAALREIEGGEPPASDEEVRAVLYRYRT